MNLDLITAGLTGFMAVCFFGAHIVTGRQWVIWPNFPPYVRRTFLLAGGVLMIRSVDLITIQHTASIGRPNAMAVITSIGLASAVGSLSWWTITDRLPVAVRQRLEWIRSTLTRNPELAPVTVLLTPDEVAGVAHAEGVAAVAPAEPLGAAWREGAALCRGYDRKAAESRAAKH